MQMQIHKPRTLCPCQSCLAGHFKHQVACPYQFEKRMGLIQTKLEILLLKFKQQNSLRTNIFSPFPGISMRDARGREKMEPINNISQGGGNKVETSSLFGLKNGKEKEKQSLVWIDIRDRMERTRKEQKGLSIHPIPLFCFPPKSGRRRGKGTRLMNYPCLSSPLLLETRVDILPLLSSPLTNYPNNKTVKCNPFLSFHLIPY